MKSRTVDIHRVARTTLLLTTVIGVCLAVLSGQRAALSAGAGGALAAANLHLIRATVSRLIARTPRTAEGVGLVVLKLALMVALLAAAFSRLPLEPVSFATGMSMLLIAVLLDACVLGAPVSGHWE